MRARKTRRKEWSLSFASMSDIAFLLIIFFIVAGKFVTQSEQDISLPAVDLGDSTDPREIKVVVDRNGRYFVNENKVEPEALQEEIEFYLMPDMSREQRTVRMYADKDAEYGAVFAAVEACNQADVYLELAVSYAD